MNGEKIVNISASARYRVYASGSCVISLHYYKKMVGSFPIYGNGVRNIEILDLLLLIQRSKGSITGAEALPSISHFMPISSIENQAQGIDSGVI